MRVIARKASAFPVPAAPDRYRRAPDHLFRHQPSGPDPRVGLRHRHRARSRPDPAPRRTPACEPALQGRRLQPGMDRAPSSLAQDLTRVDPNPSPCTAGTPWPNKTVTAAAVRDRCPPDTDRTAGHPSTSTSLGPTPPPSSTRSPPCVPTPPRMGRPADSPDRLDPGTSETVHPARQPGRCRAQHQEPDHPHPHSDHSPATQPAQ